MPRIVKVTLICDGVIGPRVCGKSAEYTGQCLDALMAAANDAGWRLERGGELAFCPKCSRPVPAWMQPGAVNDKKGW